MSTADVALLYDPTATKFKSAADIHTGGSIILQELNLPPSLDKEVLYLTVRSSHDYMYAFNEMSPCLDFADNRIVPSQGHSALRDSDPCLAIIQAFLERRLAGLSLGLPSDLPVFGERSPVGEWESLKMELPVTTNAKWKCFYSFRADGSATITDFPLINKPATYTVESHESFSHITISLENGSSVYGIFRLTATADTMALSLAPTAEARPTSLRYAQVLYRLESPVSLPILFGHWIALPSNHLKHCRVDKFELIFKPQMYVTMKRTITDGHVIKIDAKYALYQATTCYKLNMTVTASTDPVFDKLIYVGLLSLLDGKLLLEMPSFPFACARPMVIDKPAIFVKTD